MNRRKPIEGRFWPKLDKRGPNECWPWKAGKFADGYGAISSKRAHRVSWELNIGPIPAGMHVLHKCDNPICVNPTHLFLGSHVDNMRDMARKNRWNSPNKTKTHCINGHEFTPANTYVYKNGRHRQCRTCIRTIYGRPK